MPVIPYTLQWSEYITVGRKKRWCEKREQVFVEASDEVAAFLKKDDGREQRYQWKIKKQKQDAKMYTEFSLDEMIQPSDGAGEEFPVEEIIADEVHPENRDPLEIMLENEALAQLNKIADIRDKIYASKMTKKQFEVWKYHNDGHRPSHIARLLNIDESSVRERLKNAYKRIGEDERAVMEPLKNAYKRYRKDE